MRAKLKVKSVTNYDNCNQTAKLEAVTNTSEENKDFWKFTPHAELTINVCNTEAQDFFVAGQEYYLDFSSAKKTEK
ncbi:hypothetical protein [Nostoc sp. 'Peltigera membranacea cyanobiont' 232]|uniref:hypothetical protein n=1 Tax=Nostoc sp. 'Peltigera membranacea cyanobiont' 232 TaxID=2014531 RepID=UPI000B957E43|nr:hypothetical protein [Nostoc sp. 'Peltigera membranacea cyanobiont' 232]OYE02138.1 hypothetical protein CDG79_25555 [Nostoc sp. 'Peltigera membranacea cyanobiont' 232]